MNYKAIFKGTLISMIFSVICLFIGALLVYYNLLTENIINIVFFSSCVIGCFIGAFITSRTCERRILFNALGVGVLLCIVLFVTSFIINKTAYLHIKTIAMLFSFIASSIMGALFGK